ncbi:hypothetical protein [Scytonema sp. PCC 10023]|uniref:hypothetical protein n=1 Tax=Scytonema sp. PCC 10023 TaxID=1680591 RepID=UPI0039C65318
MRVPKGLTRVRVLWTQRQKNAIALWAAPEKHRRIYSWFKSSSGRARENNV